ncbi:septum site-determining protein MinD [archaeon]|nr:septum site-determining protein MinD [archaeon]
MGTSLTIISRKGGVGRTFISVNLAIAIATMGKKVLLIDGNIEQPNVGLAMNIDFSEATIHHYLAGKKELDEVISKYDGIDVIYGDIEFQSLSDIDTEKFNDMIKKLVDEYDVIVIDSPSGSNTIFAPLQSQENALVVVTPNILSVVDGMRAKNISKKLGSKIVGVVVNNTAQKKYLTNENIEFALNSKVLEEIPYEEKVETSLAMGEPLILNYPNTTVAKKIINLAHILIGVADK